MDTYTAYILVSIPAHSQVEAAMEADKLAEGLGMTEELSVSVMKVEKEYEL